jgi:hypothetical protein
MTPTLSLPPLMKQITVDNIFIVENMLDCVEIASARDYGKLSLWV